MTTLAHPRHDPSGRRKWDAVAAQGERWDRYRLMLDITDLIRLRDHLAQADMGEHDDLYEVYVALDEEVRTIPPETITLIRQEQQA